MCSEKGGYFMEFLQLKSSGNKRRSDGSTFRQPTFIRKNRKYGTIISQDTVSIKRPVLVTGAHAAGKSRFVGKLYEKEREVWGTKIKHPAIFFSAINPLSSWVENEAVGAWWDLPCDKNKTGKPWAKLKPFDKQAALSAYIVATGAVVFVDDAHKLTGRKLQVAVECVTASKIFVMSSSSEQRLPPALRVHVLKREPQMFRLNSDVSYDATTLLIWFFVLICMMAGFWEAGAVLGGLKMIAGGSRATKET
jgi:hypothetical protein